MGVEEKEGKDNNSDGKDGEKCRYPSIEGFFLHWNNPPYCPPS